MKAYWTAALWAVAISGVRADDLIVDGSVNATTNLTAGKLISAPAMRAPPTGASLVVVTNASVANDWSHISILSTGGSPASTNRTASGSGTDSSAMGIVKLASGGTFDVASGHNSPIFPILNLANRGRFQASSTWDCAFLGNINGYGSHAASNTYGIAQNAGTSLGMFSVMKGSRMYMDTVESSIVVGRLENYSRLYTTSGFTPVFCMAMLNNSADAHIQTTGAAGAILHSPSGQKTRITGAGTFTVGTAITNSHAYAMAFGANVRTVETNAVHARKFIATQDVLVAGRPVATLTYIPPQGDIAMGSYTNAP